ncbi:uncharacterized protein PAC_09736 [Phialocephala subalpina]|uniref:NAD(P)-binding domain-containing protein n=1 Tax=Phialocephala subalpina TaxID=576137 RepID=A0A1L7X4B8_9HELO|nr:uncharacterized protein PAC_09736 [Phialocephala subalpina]
MLILIAGITGNIGSHAANHALETGHKVRGLGRNPSKLPASITKHPNFNTFITSTSHDDIPALEKACLGIDAIICAYAGLPTLHLDGQLLLLRAAEKASVKRFLTAGWNYDWRKVPFGTAWPIYDSIRCFHVQAELTSSIKPLHIFSGMLADVFFGVDGQDGFTPKDGGVWDCHAEKERKEMDIWGTGDEVWDFTTERDAGRWGVEVITAEGAEEGGFVSLRSFRASLKDVKETYELVRGGEVKVRWRGSVDELEKLAVKEKEKFGRRRLWEWHRLYFYLTCLKGTWNLGELENEKFPGFEATSLEKFLKEHPEV